MGMVSIKNISLTEHLSGSNPDQTNPQHRKKEIIYSFPLIIGGLVDTHL